MHDGFNDYNRIVNDNAMASTSPKRESVLTEKPKSGKMVNAPTKETGTVMRGMERRTPILEKNEDD